MAGRPWEVAEPAWRHHPATRADSVRLGRDVVIPQPGLVNLYGCSIGDGSKIGAFVEIQKNAIIGERCKISSHAFVCEGVTIEDEVFVGHGVMFTNDLYPRADAALYVAKAAGAGLLRVAL